jgi:mRNA-degrading endonuclease RelE of RelBE toxin-antitoxin system
MIGYDFTRSAEKLFLKLPKDIQQRIIEKLEFYLGRPNPLAYAKKLTGISTPTFRPQAGAYRIVSDWEGDKIPTPNTAHRKDIYR